MTSLLDSRDGVGFAAERRPSQAQRQAGGQPQPGCVSDLVTSSSCVCFGDGCGLGRYRSCRLRDGRDRGVGRERLFSDDQLGRLRSFPDIGRGEPIRFFTLTSPCFGPVSAGLGRVEAVPSFADGRHDLGDPGVEGVKFFRLGRVGDERTLVT